MQVPRLFSLFFGLEEEEAFEIFLALVRNQQQVCRGERSEAGMATPARKQHDGSIACGQTGLSLAAALATAMDRLAASLVVASAAASRKLTLPCVGEILTQVRVRSNGRHGRR